MSWKCLHGTSTARCTLLHSPRLLLPTRHRLFVIDRLDRVDPGLPTFRDVMLCKKLHNIVVIRG